MSFLGNVNLCNVTKPACDYFPSFNGLEKGGFDSSQQQYIITTLAMSAIGAVGGLISCCVNRKAGFKVYAASLGLSALGALAFVSQYQFLGSIIPQSLNSSTSE